MLARREHSRAELVQKLINKGCPPALADAVAGELQSTRLQSDTRFVEALVRARRERGIGPLRIQHELQQKGVSETLLAHWLDINDGAWHGVVRRVRRKRFGESPPQSPKERARQARFLQYRGYTFDQIRHALDTDDQHE